MTKPMTDEQLEAAWREWAKDLTPDDIEFFKHEAIPKGLIYANEEIRRLREENKQLRGITEDGRCQQCGWALPAHHGECTEGPAFSKLQRENAKLRKVVDEVNEALDKVNATNDHPANKIRILIEERDEALRELDEADE